MKPTIGVMGSATDYLPAARSRAFALGQAIARAGCVLVTGATTGLPHEAARGARAEGGLVVGISPAIDRADHRSLGLPEEAHDFVLFSGFGFKGRNILNVRACDAVITVGGSIGTLNEFTIAVGEGKPVGTLVGTGGVADNLPEILSICGRSGEGLVIQEKDAERLVARLLDACGRDDEGEEAPA